MSDELVPTVTVTNLPGSSIAHPFTAEELAENEQSYAEFDY